MSYSINSVEEFAKNADYKFLNSLLKSPCSKSSGEDFKPREVFNGHYVLVKPTPIKEPKYVAHSHSFFKELGLDDSLATNSKFIQIFSGNLDNAPQPMIRAGWASGYALSIYGREYYEQCPFRTGNGYGDGRAVTIFEGIFNKNRWQMQLKGGGKTPYCRGADGRAVFRSSIREFLAQEHMHALGVPTTRSLTLYVSQRERVSRPWYSEYSRAYNPDTVILEPVAITTRVAPTFLRVGQLELFGRRARKGEYDTALKELEMLVKYAIESEYSKEVDTSLPLNELLLSFASAFGKRLALLVSNWIRVGYCQGNFNSDNCAIGGFSLDFGPFGFIDEFDPHYQSWTGGGEHFAFFNQPNAALKNFTMFCKALAPLISSDRESLMKLEITRREFANTMQNKLDNMWSLKLGMSRFDKDIFYQLIDLMQETSVDYTIFFRQLSEVPNCIDTIKVSFYKSADKDLLNRWQKWLDSWIESVGATSKDIKDKLSKKMKSINPKYTLREWHLVEAYKKADNGDYTLINELQKVMQEPYLEQSKEVEAKYYCKKPSELFDIAGVSFVSCSS